MSPSFGKLFVAQATSQSYVQYKLENKKVLLVAMSQLAFPEHKCQIVQLARWICQQGVGLTKDDVLAQRETMRC